MLLTENAEDPLADNVFAFLDRHHELQPKEILMMEMRLQLNRRRGIRHSRSSLRRARQAVTLAVRKTCFQFERQPRKPENKFCD